MRSSILLAFTLLLGCAFPAFAQTPAAQPPIEAIASPPRRCPRNAAAARYSARLIPAWVANSPISTNSGITDNE